ncbi:hypothetical protein Tco_0424751 [Tanacetum coccineum]
MRIIIITVVGLISSDYLGKLISEDGDEDTVRITQSNKQKEICPYGSDQLPVNNGDVLFALDNIQAPSARVTNPEHDHVRMVFGSRFFGEASKDGSPGDEETELMSALFTILEYLYSGTFCKDNGSVRADEMPRGSTDLDDDNLWLSLNADIPTHADNDLPRPYATFPILFCRL